MPEAEGTTIRPIERGDVVDANRRNHERESSARRGGARGLAVALLIGVAPGCVAHQSLVADVPLVNPAGPTPVRVSPGAKASSEGFPATLSAHETTGPEVAGGAWTVGGEPTRAVASGSLPTAWPNPKASAFSSSTGSNGPIVDSGHDAEEEKPIRIVTSGSLPTAWPDPNGTSVAAPSVSNDPIADAVRKVSEEPSRPVALGALPTAWPDPKAPETSPPVPPASVDQAVSNIPRPVEVPARSLAVAVAPRPPAVSFPKDREDRRASQDGSIVRTDIAPAPEFETAPAPGLAPAIPPPAATLPIDLPTALKLADSANPVIGEARSRIGEALGAQIQARTLLFPSLTAGGNYRDHTGNLQRSSGEILNVSLQSLYFGGGARAVAASTVEIPAVLVTAHLTDAFFEPLAARQQVTAAGFDASATANSVLLGVATEYLDLQGAMARLKARTRTEEEAAEVARITDAYARVGEGTRADADRAATEWKLRRAGIVEAEGQVAVASARLVRRLHLDPTLRIDPAGDPLALFTLVEPDRPLEEMVETAIRQRPEVLARGADVGRAEYRLKQERMRPLLPTLWAGFGGGAFGGGSNLVPPAFHDFRGRTDFDVVAYWSVRNFGLGDFAVQKRRNAEVGEAATAKVRAVNLAREQVAEARGSILARREEIAVALEEIATARDGFEKDLERIRGAAGPPLEVLDNLRYLGRAREALIDAVVGYNQAEFRLFVAMGTPPPLQGPTELAPKGSSESALAEAPAALPADRDGTLAEAGTNQPPADVADPIGASREAQTVAPGDIREAMAALARARRGAVAASDAYERSQNQLLETVAADNAKVDRKAALETLMGLAEAHRAEMGARLEYDRALWQVFESLGAVPTEVASPKPESDPRVRRSGAEAPPAPPVPNASTPGP